MQVHVSKNIVIKAIEKLHNTKHLQYKDEAIPSYITIAGSWIAHLSFFIYLFVLIDYVLTGSICHTARYIAVFLCCLSASCDGLDGYLARRHADEMKLLFPDFEKNKFGDIFDPHHDKYQYISKTSALVVDSFIMSILFTNPIFIISAIILKWIFNIRDEASSFHRLWGTAESFEMIVKARKSGKTRTRVCFTLLPAEHLILYPLAYYYEIAACIVFVLFAYIMCYYTVKSLIDYIKAYRLAINNLHENNNGSRLDSKWSNIPK